MAQEIERKFLVKGDFKTFACKQTRILQGYLSSNPERSVRVRICDGKGFLTIKGIANEAGTARYEWEKEIPAMEARELLSICEPGIIDKTRFEIKAGDHVIEVDEFYGENQGLVVAEIELRTEDENFEKPEWLGDEITGDQRYYNVNLLRHPYSHWRG